MIIVLEGANGTGKTAAAELLAQSFRIPILRAFRRVGREHFDGQHARSLEALGIPVNTYVEDAFISDILGTLRTSCILDRSMPSGVAYGLAEVYLDLSTAEALLDLWCTSLQDVGVLLIHMIADRKVRETRAHGRRFDAAVDESVRSGITWACDRIDRLTDIPVAELDTTNLDEKRQFHIIAGIVNAHSG